MNRVFVLDDDKEYLEIERVVFNGKEYVSIININDYKDFMILELSGKTFNKIREPNLLKEIVSRMYHNVVVELD